MERTIKKQIFGRRNLPTKLMLSGICLACCAFHVGFYPDCPFINHIFYSFFHVNIFHLLINIIVLWNIKNNIQTIWAFLIAIIASFLPMTTTEATMGLSGFLFSAFGIMWGKTGKLKDAFKAAMPFIIVTMFLPNVNALLHFYCFWLGYIFEFLFIKARTAVHHG